MGKGISGKSKHSKAEISMLLSDNFNNQARSIKQEKEQCFITQPTIHNECRAITDIYAPINTAANFTKKTLKITQEDIYKSLLTIGNFDNSFLLEAGQVDLPHSPVVKIWKI